jgi:biotin transport system substrate-specific component
MTTQRLYPPLIQRLIPIPHSLGRTLLCVALGVAATALFAQLRLELGAVPLTGQTLAVLLIGAAYGARLGAITLASYLGVGALGLPVFSGGASGLSTLTGVTAGYLVGFVLAAAVVGALAERGWDRRPVWTALAMLIGNVLIYLPGLLWLGQFMPDWSSTLRQGLAPFIIGDIIKLMVAAGLLPAVWKLLERA